MNDEIIISALSTVSAFGSNREALDEAIETKKIAMTFEHPYQRCTKSPLAFIAEHPYSDSLGTKQFGERLAAITTQLIGLLVEDSDVYGRYHPRRVGVMIGSTTTGMSQTIKAVEIAKENSKDSGQASDEWKAVGKAVVREVLQDNIFASLESKFPVIGPRSIISTACSSGALAVVEGARMIESGQVDCCIVGGVDVLTEITIAGFSSLQLVDDDFCKPFRKDRKGLNLGEGGAFFLLERASTKPTKKIARIFGSGVGTDVYHQTRPAPDGGIMEACMRSTIQAVDPTQLPNFYINAHGTGTEANDLVERDAIERVFGSNARFESTKRLHGHCLAGAGALELAVSLGVLRRQLQSHPRQPALAISNSFGFGGSCVSIGVESLEGRE